MNARTGTLFALAAALVWPVMVSLFLGGHPPTPAGLIPLIVLVLVYSALHLAVLFCSGEPRLLEAMFWLFIYLVAGVVPLAQVKTGLRPNLLTQDTLVHAQVIVLVACVSYDVGHRLDLFRNPGTVWNPRVLSLRRLQLLSSVSLVASTYYVSVLGGPATFFVSREDIGNVLGQAGFSAQEGSSLVALNLLTAFGTAPVLLCMAGWLSVVLRDRHSRTVGPYAWLAVLFAFNVIVNNPVSSARFWFVTAIVGTVFSIPGLSRRFFRTFLVSTIVAAILIFPYSDYFRLSDRGAILVKPITYTLSTKDYDQTTMAANGVTYADQNGHTYGYQMLGAATFWVPRSIWPSKPIDTGVLIGRTIPGAGTTNLSSPLWIEAWLDFAMLGVFAIFVAVGALARRLDSNFVRLAMKISARPTLVQVLLPFLAGYSLIVLRGPLLQASANLVVIVGICLVLCPRRERK